MIPSLPEIISYFRLIIFRIFFFWMVVFIQLLILIYQHQGSYGINKQNVIKYYQDSNRGFLCFFRFFQHMLWIQHIYFFVYFYRKLCSSFSLCCGGILEAEMNTGDYLREEFRAHLEVPRLREELANNKIESEFRDGCQHVWLC